MHEFKRLVVWKNAIDLAVDIYQLSKQFPTDERFGLITQVHRCAVSIASNIAEGAGRNTTGEFIHFLGIAAGSTAELETQLIIANKLNYISYSDMSQLVQKILEIQNKVYRLQSALKNKTSSSHT